MDTDIESLERATLDAVAPEAIEELAGWLLPFDTTTVGRAISAVPLRHANIDPTLITAIEASYTKRGLSAQFRVADVPGLAPLRQGLLDNGYTARQATLTLVGSVDKWLATAADSTVQLSTRPTEAWASVYLSVDFDPIDGANRVRALSRSPCLVYATLCDNTGVTAAGTASFSHGWASLHGLRTITRERGKGHASALIAALGQESGRRKLTRCFLQVEAENANAIRLYRSLGFQTAWLYHYWRKGT